jgi:hypothetical protein
MIYGTHESIYFPALFLSLAFSLSICFSSALSTVIAPLMLLCLASYAASFSSFSLFLSPAKNRASFRSSRIAPFLSCLYCDRSLEAALRSASGS